MMSSRRGKPTHTTGAHRAQRRAQSSAQGTPGSSSTGGPTADSGAPGGGASGGSTRGGGASGDGSTGSSAGSSGSVSAPEAERPAPGAAPERHPQQLTARYEPHLDGLFTYCLSVLCEHEAATTVLGDVMALAQVQDGRRPADGTQYRSWLYALARWACLQRLAEQRRTGGAPAPAPLPEAPRPDTRPSGTSQSAARQPGGARPGAPWSGGSGPGASVPKPAPKSAAKPAAPKPSAPSVAKPPAANPSAPAPFVPGPSAPGPSAPGPSAPGPSAPKASGSQPSAPQPSAPKASASKAPSPKVPSPKVPASKGAAPKSPAPSERRPAPSAPGAQAPPGTPEASGVPEPLGTPEPSGAADPSETAASRHRRELAALAWPEAAGTTPEQREALELAVRHQLPPDEVAAVLGLEPDAARALLSSAACEVERTRAALVVVERGNCPVVARLTGDSQVLLGAALRRELVRHVDDCPDCRRTAERATARGPWPGSTAEPGTLPVLEAPRAAAYAAMARTRRGGRAIGRTGPRYHRSGFPMDPKDRVARRRRMRSRAVTTAVVATVVAAPLLALWAAYQQAPVTGEGRETGSVTAADAGPGGLSAHPYEEAGNAEAGPEAGFRTGGRSPDVSVEVVDRNGERHSAGHRGRGTPTARSSWSSLPSGTTRTGSGALAPPGGPVAKGPGRLTVAAQPSGGTTLITLTASGGSPVRWSASTDALWLRLSLTAGLLRPGESVTITAMVDHDREPAGPWTARVSVAPAGAVVAIEGRGTTPGPTTTPTPSEPSPTPTPPGPSAPEEPSESGGTASQSGSATAVPSE